MKKWLSRQTRDPFFLLSFLTLRSPSSPTTSFSYFLKQSFLFFFICLFNNYNFSIYQFNYSEFTLFAILLFTFLRGSTLFPLWGFFCRLKEPKKQKKLIVITGKQEKKRKKENFMRFLIYSSSHNNCFCALFYSLKI